MPIARFLPLSGTATMAALAAIVTVAGCAAFVDNRADRRESDWQDRYPPQGRLIAVEGRNLHVHEAGRPAGSAPDVVLIHGANGNLRDFTFDLVDRLAPDFRVIAVDRPGLGWSDSWGAAEADPQFQAQLLRQALGAELGLRNPIVVGHSYGGAVAMGWALEAEAETAGLVILGGATQPWEGNLGLGHRLQSGPLGGVGRSVIAGLISERTARGALSTIFSPDPVPSGYAAHFGVGLAMRRDQRAASTRQVDALRDHLTRMAPQYPGLTLPIEALHGSRDTIVGLEIHSRRLAAEVASVRLTVLDDVGHMPHHARPEETVAAIHRIAERAGLR